MKLFYKLSSIFFVTVFSLSLASCGVQQIKNNSSVVDYLYPKDSNVAVTPSLTHLQLPLKVGIAFVPEADSQRTGNNYWTGARTDSALTEEFKNRLLERVANNFRGREFIRDIQVIPSAYLKSQGSFANLDQIKSMYGVDVIALVSYDQVQFTDEGALSFTYWTLVGAYIVSGEKNSTSTMIDTAVYDIASRKMLFRAPGTSNIKGRATPVNLSEQLRSDSTKSFEEATENMIANLETEISNFREKIKQNLGDVKVERPAIQSSN